MGAEERFKQAVRDLHSEGIYPGPTAIKRRLGQGGKSNNINGRQSVWRRQEMKRLGIPLQRPHATDMQDVMYGEYVPDHLTGF